MTGHWFRALAMTTIKEKLGWRHKVVDRQLAHVPKSKVDRAYDRAKFLRSKDDDATMGGLYSTIPTAVVNPNLDYSNETVSLRLERS